MDRNFRVRMSAGLLMFAVAMVALYTFNSAPFKIFFALFAFVALIELFSFFKKKSGFINYMLAALEVLFLIWGTIFVANINISNCWYVILGVPGYDVFAYFFGKMFGGKVFKKSRPFPHISKNKTWEGTIMGLLISILLVLIKLLATSSFQADWVYLLCGPFALIGDLFESYLKRKFDIKDSNEILIKNKFFSKLELIVGGSEGHGGFLDRIDSTAFACTALMIIISLI